MGLEIGFISIQETVQPRQQLLSTVVGVQDNWDAVRGSDGADELSTSDASGDRGLLV